MGGASRVPRSVASCPRWGRWQCARRYWPRCMTGLPMAMISGLLPRPAICCSVPNLGPVAMREAVWPSAARIPAPRPQGDRAWKCEAAQCDCVCTGRALQVAPRCLHVFTLQLRDTVLLPAACVPAPRPLGEGADTRGGGATVSSVHGSLAVPRPRCAMSFDVARPRRRTGCGGRRSGLWAHFRVPQSGAQLPHSGVRWR